MCQERKNTCTAAFVLACKTQVGDSDAVLCKKGKADRVGQAGVLVWRLSMRVWVQGALSEEEDPRVDVALYFIAPHRLRPVDVDFITRLSELVPVVRRSHGAAACQRPPVVSGVFRF